jgi:hypothetical protein
VLVVSFLPEWPGRLATKGIDALGAFGLEHRHNGTERAAPWAFGRIGHFIGIAIPRRLLFAIPDLLLYP